VKQELINVKEDLIDLIRYMAQVKLESFEQARRVYSKKSNLLLSD